MSVARAIAFTLYLTAKARPSTNISLGQSKRSRVLTDLKPQKLQNRQSRYCKIRKIGKAHRSTYLGASANAAQCDLFLPVDDGWRAPHSLSKNARNVTVKAAAATTPSTATNTMKKREPIWLGSGQHVPQRIEPPASPRAVLRTRNIDTTLKRADHRATLRAQRWARLSRVQARLLDRDREERESGGFEDEDREDDESGDGASLNDEAN
ncbi:hypothetical protein B0H13DRAFT_1918887 [Mycena leptocephala]|nr:hypothetical protein B0H13DRAFT_1918887 [Mycena leptocephala]